MTLHDGVVSIYEGQAALDWIREQHAESRAPENMVRVLTAYRGVVSGRVRVVGAHQIRMRCRKMKFWSSR